MTQAITLIPKFSKDMKGHDFDEIEVHPCKVVDENKSLPSKIQAVEQCEPEEAEFWSVYVHYEKGGLDCIADCATEKDANDLKDFLLEFVERFVK